MESTDNLSGFPRQCYIKPFLVQCANAVVKSFKHSEIRRCYRCFKKCHGHKKAIIAITRMLLTSLYHMLKHGENYNAEFYRKSDRVAIVKNLKMI